MSIVIRCVTVEDESKVKVEEFFLGFIKVQNTLGLGLFKRLDGALVDLKLNIDDIRRQGYDNGSNMKEDIVFSEAKGLCKNALEDFEFLISLCIWYKILDKVNQVSKILQREEMDIEDAITRIKELILFFEEFREDDFEDLMKEAKELAHDVGFEPVFAEKRVVQRKKQFDEDVVDDAHGSQSPKERFRTSYFLFIIDQALASLKDRFKQFELYDSIFGFLFNAKFKSVSEDQLMEHCTKLESFLEYKQRGDIYGNELFQELRHLKIILPREVTKSIDILDFIKSYWKDGGFQMVWVAYRILLTIPVTVASAERSFSKLKLIKTYLRTTMSQERLNGLAMISIENEYLDKLE
ncbi:uncharacterized protein LOC131303155 [Rhododendron vialii]|uniref:uncharacterized protein LOC131303155 n=1 Tax=Rhododendron vialii TaxID=182163 RepID=UPI00265E9CB6|nr:uncharacterized protein LOC131303155 [Rhododendron vialii]